MNLYPKGILQWLSKWLYSESLYPRNFLVTVVEIKLATSEQVAPAECGR